MITLSCRILCFVLVVTGLQILDPPLLSRFWLSRPSYHVAAFRPSFPCRGGMTVSRSPATGTATGRTKTSATTTTLFMAKKKKKNKNSKDGSGRPVCVNRVANRNYEILETLEAGISLVGTEVKSVRDGKMDLRDGYVKASHTGCTLLNVHIAKHDMTGEYFQHDEKRPRQLLVHKSEARKWMQQTERAQGMTIVPLKAYFNQDNRLKIQIGLARGKNVRDKRATIRERDAKLEANRIIKNFRI